MQQQRKDQPGMQTTDFTKDTPGRLVRSPSGAPAFVPEPLPPNLGWDNNLVAHVSDAQHALGELAGIGRNILNPHLLIRPFLHREAVRSSQIEGTQASLPDLFLFQLDRRVEKRTPDVREVSNYVATLDHGLRLSGTLPLSQRFLRDLHRVLMEGVRGSDRRPGEFRRKQVWIGQPGSNIEDAIYVPPPPGPELAAALDEFEKYLHRRSDLPPIVRMALVHYQFEAIHPFEDGNGRIGRVLITLMLVMTDVLPMPLLYLSEYFEKHRAEYYARLLGVSQRAQWHEWLLFFLTGVSEQSRNAVAAARRLLALRDEYVERVQAPGASALAPKLVDQLFATPIVNAKMVAEVLAVQRQTAQTHIDRLMELGILRELTGYRRNRVYAAQDIMFVADGRAEPGPSR